MTSPKTYECLYKQARMENETSESVVGIKHLVGNGPLLASTIDEEHLIFIHLHLLLTYLLTYLLMLLQLCLQ